MENMPLRGMARRSKFAIDTGLELFELRDVAIGMIIKCFFECLKLLFFDIGEMIELYDMHADIEQLQPYPKSGEAKIARLYEYDDRTLRKSEEFRKYRCDLWIDIFGSARLDQLMMIETDPDIFREIMRSNYAILLRNMWIFWIEKATTIEGLWRVLEFANN
jgi:hypothetical protein